MTPKIAFVAIALLTGSQLATIGAASAAKLKAEPTQHRVGLLLPAIQAAAVTRATPHTAAVTCDQSGPTGCDLDEFVYLCDAGNGSMSSEPGGGVTCDLNN